MECLTFAIDGRMVCLVATASFRSYGWGAGQNREVNLLIMQLRMSWLLVIFRLSAITLRVYPTTNIQKGKKNCTAKSFKINKVMTINDQINSKMSENNLILVFGSK